MSTDPGNSIDLILVRLAHVENRQPVAAVEAFLELDGTDVSGVVHRCWLRCGINPAKLVVVDELGDGRVRTAYRAVGILPELQLAELHSERVEDEESADERLAGADDELDRLGRLDAPDHAREHAEHASFGAAGNEARRRRLGIQAPIARAFLGREHGRLPLEPENAAIDIRLVEQHARVVDEIAGREIVGAVDDDVVGREQVERVLGRDRRVVRDDLDQRVDVTQSILAESSFDLPTSDVP
jgi:hypothetical protein